MYYVKKLPIYTFDNFINELGTLLGPSDPEDIIEKTITINYDTINEPLHGDIIRIIKKYLKARGYYSGSVSGVYNENFRNAIMLYQRTCVGLTYPDGKITAKGNTWKTLLKIK